MGQEEDKAGRDDDEDFGTVHLKFRVKAITVLGMIGAVCAFIVMRWEQVEPILNSPIMPVITILVCLFLGGVVVYWLAALPAIRRGSRAEGVIRGLREREREFFDTIGDMKAMIASLETEVKHLKEYVERLEGSPKKL